MHTQLPSDEEARLGLLHSYGIPDTPDDAAFDDIARLAAAICEAPMALLTLVDADRQWVKARVGLPMRETPRALSFCGHAILERGVTVVPDARFDPRFAAHPLVIGSARVRFFAGAPLVAADGHALGTVCVLDTASRRLTAVQRAALEALARQVVAQLDLRRVAAEQGRALRRQSETLRAEARSLDGAVEAGWVGTWAWDEATRCLTWSDSTRAIHGLPPGPRTGTWEACSESIHPEDRETVRLSARRCLADGGEHHMVYRALLPDGAVRSVEARGRAVRDARGQVVGIAGTCVDATHRVEAEAALRERERQLRALTDNVPALIARVGRDRRYLFCNRTYEDFMGMRAHEVVGRTMADVLGQETYDLIRPYVDRAVAGERVAYEAALSYQRRGTRQVHVSYVPEFGPGGEVTAFVLCVLDITDLRRAEDASRQLALLVEHSYDAIIGTAPDGTITSWNGGAERLFGYTAAEAAGRSVSLLSPPESPGEEQVGLKALEHCEAVLEYQAVRVRKDGARRVVAVTVSPLRDHTNRPTGHVSIVRDVTEQVRLEEERGRLFAEAIERADQDPLTGLLNHRAFQRRLREEAHRAEREGRPLAVVMLDLDNFKFFNDAYGHLAGDDVLRQVADALRGACRSYDTLARFGGDEFALLLPGLGRGDAEERSRRIIARLGAEGYVPPGQDVPLPLTLSAGVAVFPDEAPGCVPAVELADSRLRLTKAGADDEAHIAGELRADLARELAGFAMLHGLVQAVDTKDRYTRRHSEDVLTHSLRLACALGLDEAAQRTVAVAALLHDVGKVGVPDAVLRKPGRLTDKEREAVRQHPEMGAAIVAAVPGFEDTLDTLRHHHERWDGDGYPAGLAGEAIPLLARLMAVADAFSAMTTDRPYRKGMAPAQAREVLRAGAGTQWDPAFVEAFLRVCE